MNFSKRFLESQESTQNRQQSIPRQRTQSNSELLQRSISGYERMGSLRQQDSSMVQSQLEVNREAKGSSQAKISSIVYDLSIKSGDCHVFLSLLRDAVKTNKGNEVAIVEAVFSMLERAIIQLDGQAINADGGQFDVSDRVGFRGLKRRFDRSVANLSGMMQVLNASPRGGGLVGRLSRQVAELIARRNDIGRWDEALGNTLVNGDFATMQSVKDGDDVDVDSLGGGSIVLARQVVTILQQGQGVNFGTSSSIDKANDILENVEKGAKLLSEASKKLTERTAKDQSLIDINIANWGSMASSPEQLQQGIDAARDSHGTFAQLDAMAGNTLGIFDELQQLQTVLPDGDLRDKLQERIGHYQGHFNDAVELSQTAQAQYADMIRQWDDMAPYEQEDSFVGTIMSGVEFVDGLRGNIGKGQKALSLIANIYLKSDVERLLSAANNNDSAQARRAMNDLVNKAGRLGLSSVKLGEMQSAFDTLTESNTYEPDLNKFNATVNDLEVFDQKSVLGTSLKAAGLLLATASFIMTVDEAEFNLRDLVSTGSAAVGLGSAGVALVSSNVVWQETASRKLASLGKKFGIVGMAFSAFDTIDNLMDGDYAAASVSGMGVLGGVVTMTLGSGPGLVVGLAALALSIQLSRVAASNVLETKHTEAFLMGLGIPQDVAYHLRNADSEGRSIGRALSLLMVESGIPPETFTQRLAALSPEQANFLAVNCHSVDPNRSGEIPHDGPYDQFAGMSDEEFMEVGYPILVANNDVALAGGAYSTLNINQYTKPTTIMGLKTFLERHNSPLLA